MGIPITVGVTGHRDYRIEDEPKLRALVHTELSKIKKTCPNSELVLLSSLAAGADMLCAEEAINLGYRLICPLPDEIEVFKKDFSEEESEKFDALISKAEEYFITPFTEEGDEGRHYRFRQAGIYIATHSHVLLALWDGKPGKASGCGTADAVSFMLENSFGDSKRASFRAEGAVIHVFTPREGGDATEEPSVKLLENTEGELEDVLKRTDVFNEDCKKTEIKHRSILGEHLQTKTIHQAEICCSEAAGLSRHFQQNYLKSLLGLSIFCVILVLSYLTYDEFTFLFMLPVYAVTLILYYVIYRWIVRGRFHEKYIEYRMLAESLRVQIYLTSLNIEENAATNYTWTQKRETVWIRKGIASVLAGERKSTADPKEISHSWIDEQLSYHRSAYQKNHRKDEITGKISTALLISIVILFVIVLVLELFFQSFMASELLGVTFSGWFKVIWGVISAVTVFISGYYGNLSYERKAEDNLKMILLFEKAKEAVEAHPEQMRELFSELAREEIIENGNWASYCKENRPMFNL